VSSVASLLIFLMQNLAFICDDSVLLPESSLALRMSHTLSFASTSAAVSQLSLLVYTMDT